MTNIERNQDPEGPVAATVPEELPSEPMGQEFTESIMFEGLLDNSSETNRSMDDMEVYASMCSVGADLEQLTPPVEVRVEAPLFELDEHVHIEGSGPKITHGQEEPVVDTTNIEDNDSTEINPESSGLHIVEYQSLYRTSSSTRSSRHGWRTIATGCPIVYLLDKDKERRFEAQCLTGVGFGGVDPDGVRLVVSVGDEKKKWTAEADVGSFVSEFEFFYLLRLCECGSVADQSSGNALTLRM